MITASRLVRRFGSRVVVRDVSLDVRAGEIVALLGPNGAGKTTTLRMLAGLIAPTSGSITIDGVPLTRATGAALRGRIGVLTESPGLWDRLTVVENLAVYADLYALAEPDRAIDRLLDVLELSDHRNARGAELSKGMRQKVALARALLHDPRVLLLDEPTSGLDPEIARSVRRLLEDRRASGCAILVSTHNLDEAERLADRVAVLHERLVALDTPAALRRRLRTGRVIVRLQSDAVRWLPTAQRYDPASSADGAVLTLRPAGGDEDTPLLVRDLVAAGAAVFEVRPEMPALEDVYLHLVGENGGTGAVWP